MSAILFLVSTILVSTAAFCDAMDASQCIWPLGMESGNIADEDITASSSFDSGNVGPQNARIRTDRLGGAWCPRRQATEDAAEWLQVDLRAVHLVTAVETQGRFGNGQGREFAETYLLQYWRPGLHDWLRYGQVLQGNKNTYLESRTELEPPVWASKIRFFPVSHHPRTVCMRVELYGCRYTDGVLSYTMPPGDGELVDSGYDGLGLLTDGRLLSRVGWNNDTRGRPVEITFEFDVVREFEAVHIFSDNRFTENVRVFSQVDVLFSVGGRHFSGEPTFFVYPEDHVSENPRNVSFQLHRRVGRFIRLRLHFAAAWIAISEVFFDSVPAHGNFSAEAAGADASPRPGAGVGAGVGGSAGEVSQLAVVAGALGVAALLLGGAAYALLTRFRRRETLTPPSPLPLSHDAAFCVRKNVATLDPLLSSGDYQEPFYTYASVLDKCLSDQSEVSHDYAVPDYSCLSLPPFLSSQSTSSTESLAALRQRLESNHVPDIPRHRLRMLSRLSEGCFGTIYVAEADGIPEYGSTVPCLGKRLVVVKSLPVGSHDKERNAFLRDARILSALEDSHLSRVVALCSLEEPLGVVMEYLEHGDLHSFLRQHKHEDEIGVSGPSVSSMCLLYIASQIASAMSYLESLNFVHRDLATRNCLVGKAYHIKVCDLGSNDERFADDYVPVEGGRLLPIRWMAWESVCQGKYTTKSDVWAFGVTLAEVLGLSRRRPYEFLGDAQVLASLRRCAAAEAPAVPLPAAPCGPRDVQQLMLECWRRHDFDRPSFREIQLFLRRKTLGYAPLSPS